MVNLLIGVSGIFILVGGCYSSISASESLPHQWNGELELLTSSLDLVIQDYANGTVSGAFSCENNGF